MAAEDKAAAVNMCLLAQSVSRILDIPAVVTIKFSAVSGRAGLYALLILMTLRDLPYIGWNPGRDYLLIYIRTALSTLTTL